MKLLTWNINGLRATTYSGHFSDSKLEEKTIYSGAKPTFKTLKPILEYLDADIICFQEVKTARDQLEEQLALVEGYSAYFSFCKRKSAYSGVATYCKNSCLPTKVEEGLSNFLTGESKNSLSQSQNEDVIGCYGDLTDFSKDELKELETEGRSMITQFDLSDESSLCIINVYCPYGGEEGERTEFKLKFYKLLQTRANALLASGHRVIIVGDINTSHHLIDHCEGSDRDPVEFYENPGRTFLSSFLHPCSPDCKDDHDVNTREEDPFSMFSDDDFGDKEVVKEDKAQVPAVIDSPVPSQPALAPFCDAFRFYHPSRRDAFTCWNTSIGARATNYGTRIDYIFPDVATTRFCLKKCDLMPEIQGSDHCPVKAEFLFEVHPAEREHRLATRFWPEFAGGRQKTINAFFKKRKSDEDAGGEKRTKVENDVDGDSFPTMKSFNERLKNPAMTVPGKKLESRTDGKDPCQSTFAKSAPTKLTPGTKPKSVLDIMKTAPAKASDLKSHSKSNTGFKPKSVMDLMKGSQKSAISNHSAKKSSVSNTAQKPISNSSSQKPTTSDSPMSFFLNSQKLRTQSLSSQKPSVSNNSAQKQIPNNCSQKENESNSKLDSFGTKSETSNNDSTEAWKKLLKGPDKAPLCKGHGEPCVANKVKKQGPNFGKKFYACARPTGHASNKEARCNHFQWEGKA